MHHTFQPEPDAINDWDEGDFVFWDSCDPDMMPDEEPGEEELNTKIVQAIEAMKEVN